jgi:colanic acid/amylovoran biosynthesis glycosyltransferase
LKTVIFFTSSFPFPHGEQFIETEIKYLENIPAKIIVVPQKCKGYRRPIPDNIELDLSFSRKSKFAKIFIFFYYLLKAASYFPPLKKSFFKIKSISDFRNIVTTFGQSAYLYTKLKKTIREYDSRDLVIYSFWYGPASYAGSKLKELYPSIKLFSRAHNCDLYVKEKPYHSIAIKKFAAVGIDVICPVSENGKQYLSDVIGLPADKLKTYRLGVKKHPHISMYNLNNDFSIVSCSFINSSKRVHAIVDVLSVFSEMFPEVQIKWTHIGDGKSRNAVNGYARKKLTAANIQYEFLGHIPNDRVYSFYLHNKVDGFLNLSSAEGIPVSIMEALSFGIPVVATDVGGVSELVNKNNGFLIEKELDVRTAAGYIKRLDVFKNLDKRKKIKGELYELYSAEVNYPKFVKEILLS